MNWREKIFKKHLKETLFTSIFSTILILMIIIGNQFFWWSFQWQEIDPIDMPPIWIRGVLSFFAFYTLGKLLFEAYFYKILYEVMKFFGSSYREYERTKKKIWYMLMFVTAFVVIPWIIDVLNSILSFFFNIFQFLISIWHFTWISLGITLIIVLGYFYITKKEPLIFKIKK